MTSVNGDIWFRSSVGYNSFITARRNFGSGWANTPNSREVQPILDYDDPALLYYGSGILFDNRFLSTVGPNRDPEIGHVQHRGLVSINFDLVSDLGQKTAPAWEGVWDCSLIQILQLNQCRIQRTPRAFMFATGCSGIELWEILRDNQDTADTYSNVTDGVTTITRGRIVSVMETRAENYGRPDLPKNLHMGTLGIDEIADTVTVVFKFRPDQYPDWITWQTKKVCAAMTQCTLPIVPEAGDCTIWRPNARTYAAEIRIPQPPETCNLIAQQPVSRANEFQFRIEITGHCRIRKWITDVNLQTDPSEGECDNCETINAY
jgi:hypothetical protein